MGVDFLDLMFRCEHEFKIKLDRKEFVAQLKSQGLTDIRVRDFVLAVQKIIQIQNPSYEGDVFERVKQIIVACLAVAESEVVPEAWMVRDLGME